MYVRIDLTPLPRGAAKEERKMTISRYEEDGLRVIMETRRPTQTMLTSA